LLDAVEADIRRQWRRIGRRQKVRKQLYGCEHGNDHRAESRS
jgi:hypothetical protein